MIHVLFTLLLAPLLRRLAGAGEPTAPRRVLVIQLAKIGDMLCSTPVFREIRRRHPETELSVLAHPVNAAMLRLNPNIDHVIEGHAGAYRGLRGKRQLVRLLRGGRYDVLVCLNASATYPVCALWAGIPVRLGILPNFLGTTYRLAARLWTASTQHRGDRLIQQTYLDLLKFLDVEDGSISKDVTPPAGAADKVALLLGPAPVPWLGIGVSSANKLKELGTEKIVAVAGKLLEEHPPLHIVLIGADGDRPQAQAILSGLAHDPRVVDVTGRLELAELPALLQRLRTYVGVDSGVTYMADAVGIPVVSVAGPCNMAETRPLGAAVIILQKALPCAPCAHIFKAPYTCRTGTHACTRDIAAEDIAAAALQLLNRPAAKVVQ